MYKLLTNEELDEATRVAQLVWIEASTAEREAMMIRANSDESWVGPTVRTVWMAEYNQAWINSFTFLCEHLTTKHDCSNCAWCLKFLQGEQRETLDQEHNLTMGSWV